MQQAFLDVNGIRTNVLSYGKWVEESFDKKDPEDVILVIPGNPGVTGFYKMFMSTLHEKTGLPVWIVGHAGHEIPRNNTLFPIPPLKGNEKLFGLQGQLEHKVDFIRKYVPENTRLHFIGHSIGSYIILNMLKIDSIKSRVVSVNLLFPTIEYMAETPNGKFLTSFVKPILWLIIFLSWIYTILPSVLSNILMYIYMKVVSMPKMHFRTLVNFINPGILEKVFFMAFEELEQVKGRDDVTINASLGKIKLLYGFADGWAPPRLCEKLKADIPGIDAQISKYDHAFVMRQSREVGDFISRWVK